MEKIEIIELTKEYIENYLNKTIIKLFKYK